MKGAGRLTVTAMLSSGLGHQAGVFPMSHGGRPGRGKAGTHHLEQLLAYSTVRATNPINAFV